MPRHLTPQVQARFRRWGQEREHLSNTLRGASPSEKVQAYRKLEKRLLTEAHTPFEQLELKRRITEDLLMATSEGSWRMFSPYLRRMERLGYSSMDCRLLVCSWAARASKDSAIGRRRAASLIADIERRLRNRKVPPMVRGQFEAILMRARQRMTQPWVPGNRP